MSLATRKPVFGVCDQVRLKPTCTATETSWRLETLDIEIRGIILSKQWITKALIRLRGCAGWSAPLLFAYDKNRFSHGVAQMKALIAVSLLLWWSNINIRHCLFISQVRATSHKPDEIYGIIERLSPGNSLTLIYVTVCLYPRLEQPVTSQMRSMV